MTRELPLPPHFRPDAVGEVWRVPYEERARGAAAWAAEHGVAAAADDTFRFCLVIVDAQNTFCTPGFELFVPGAPDDNRRLCEFVYRNVGAITQIVPTLDTHQAAQIFHAAWLVDGDGNRPAPHTIVSADDVASRRWRVDPATARSLDLDPGDAQRHLLHYTRTLEQRSKYQLTIWPYHAMLGGIGHALVSAVEEAVFFHAVVRASQPDFQVKGLEPLTEHYSVLGPEVTAGPDGEPLGVAPSPLVEKLRTFDAVAIAGQAKSHCVAWTIDGLLTELPDLAHKVYLLEDCSSPVVVPGVVDYTDEADAAFERFAEAGMHIVTSTQPVAEWPGLAAPARG